MLFCALSPPVVLPVLCLCCPLPPHVDCSTASRLLIWTSSCPSCCAEMGPAEPPDAFSVAGRMVNGVDREPCVVDSLDGETGQHYVEVRVTAGVPGQLGRAPADGLVGITRQSQYPITRLDEGGAVLARYDDSAPAATRTSGRFTSPSARQAVAHNYQARTHATLRSGGPGDPYARGLGWVSDFEAAGPPPPPPPKRSRGREVRYWIRAGLPCD